MCVCVSASVAAWERERNKARILRVLMRILSVEMILTLILKNISSSSLSSISFLVAGLSWPLSPCLSSLTHTHTLTHTHLHMLATHTHSLTHLHSYLFLQSTCTLTYFWGNIKCFSRCLFPIFLNHFLLKVFSLSLNLFCPIHCFKVVVKTLNDLQIKKKAQ